MFGVYKCTGQSYMMNSQYNAWSFWFTLHVTVTLSRKK